MSTLTVQDFATELKRPVAELLSQFKEAGVSVKDEASAITAEDKLALLSYLKHKTGAPAAAAAMTRLGFMAARLPGAQQSTGQHQAKTRKRPHRSASATLRPKRRG